mgnify:CR=1 FL=1
MNPIHFIVAEVLTVTELPLEPNKYFVQNDAEPQRGLTAFFNCFMTYHNNGLVYRT